MWTGVLPKERQYRAAIRTLGPWNESQVNEPLYYETSSLIILFPPRNIPLSLVISMATIIIIYVLTNIAYFTLLSPEEVLSFFSYCCSKYSLYHPYVPG